MQSEQTSFKPNNMNKPREKKGIDKIYIGIILISE